MTNQDARSVPAADPIGNRRGRILIVALVFWCVAIIAAVRWYYGVEKSQTEDAAMRETFAVAAGKAVQVAAWRRERIGNGHMVMSSPFVRTALRALASRTVADGDRADLLELMRGLARAFAYADITLVDLDGNQRVRLHADRTDGAEFGKTARSGLAREAVRRNDVILSDLTLETRTRTPLMALTVPVSDAGAFILEIDPSLFLFPFVEAWPGSSRTALCELVRLEGNEAVSLSTAHPGMAAFSRRPRILTLPPDRVLESGWSLKGVDNRGILSIGTMRRIPDSPWLLICKMAIAEVDAPLRRLAWEMALITALIAFASAAAAGLIWRGQQARIHRDREEWFYAVANDTPAYLWMASRGEENSFVNRPLQKFMGVDRQSLAEAWIDSVHPDDAGRVHAGYLKAMSEMRGSIDEFRMRRADGEYRTVAGEAVPRFSAAGQFLGYAGSIVDITDRRRAEEQLRQTNARLETELAVRIRKEQEIQALSARLMGAREDERTRLARELHDDLNQQIAAVSIAVGNLKRHIPEEQAEARAQSDRIHQKLVQLAERVRRMSHELHPAILEYQGIAVALRAFCNEFETLTRVRVSFTSEGAFDNVPAATALCVYRITQEALQNVAKHAHADAARVELVRAEGTLRLTISDAGAGMDPASTEMKPGLGLLSIKERVRLAGGMVEIRSQPNEGTFVTVTIPL
jgi:PAS domain S-box-containing protein